MHVCNRRRDDAEINDYYATDPKAVEILLENEKFNNIVWEPACGEGHISKVLKKHGYSVYSSDLVDRNYGVQGDFFEHEKWNDFDIITNPPYKLAAQFVEHALDISEDDTKIAMLLKLTFLEGQARRELFKKYLPKTIYVFSSRIECGKNGVFKGASAVAYAWFVWEKGFKGNPVIKWVN